MENRENRTEDSKKNIGNTKLDRLQSRLLKLQEEAKQARERLREEESAQEKLTRLMERRRIETEQRNLGLLAYSAGLAEYRMPWVDSSGEFILMLDGDLLTGAMELLADQLRELTDHDELEKLRARGQVLRSAYLAGPDNPRFRIPLVGIAIPNQNKGEE